MTATATSTATDTVADRRTVVAVLALAVVGLGAGALWLFPDAVSRLRQLGAYAAADSDCDLAAAPCTASFPDGTAVTLAISPTGIPTDTTLMIDVRVDPPGPVPTTLELQGVDMNMGLLQSTLTDHGDGHATGTLVVPLCTTERMKWHADVVLSDRTAGYGFHVEKDHNPGPAPTYGDFTVQTASGPLSLADLRGQVVIVYFGYTSCPDICPTTLQTVAAALHALPEDKQDRVTAVLISLDPERDTLEHLQEYTAWFHPRIRGGTDSAEAIAELAGRWGVSWRKVEAEGSAMGYTLDHDSRAFLIAPDGRMVGTVRHGTPADSLARQVESLLP